MSNDLPTQTIFGDLVKIIEKCKQHVYKQVNNQVLLMFWEVGDRINRDVLNNERAEYGKRIIPTLSGQLQSKYGGVFNKTNLSYMVQFATQFPDSKIVATLSQQLSWSHIKELLPLKTPEARIYYINEVHKGMLSVRDLRYLISRKAFERQEIGDAQLSERSVIPFNAFKDPCLLDVLGLKDNFLEADLEQAIVDELGKVFLEFGQGFALVGRQRKFIFEGNEYKIDLLLYNRLWKRFVVVELKKGKFKPEYMGQLKFYLKYLNEFERTEGEEAPIGLVLCTEKSPKQMEMLELDKEGIFVAEFWTKLLPKKEFESKINALLDEAQERLERRKQLGHGTVQKQIDYFIEEDEED